MNLPVILAPAAGRESEQAADWYEQTAGLGADSVDRVQQALDRIGRMPEAAPAIFMDIRRVRVQRFPYSVLYHLLDDRVEVIAVFHNKRDPAIWKSRV
jgi:toxin ParE1/3/4